MWLSVSNTLLKTTLKLFESITTRCKPKKCPIEFGFRSTGSPFNAILRIPNDAFNPFDVA